MYCINCGVKLADTEKECPLCGLKVYHPDIINESAPPMYPAHRYPESSAESKTAVIILTAVFLLPILITLVCDFQLNACISWSGYVVGAVLTVYMILVFPAWFAKQNCMISIPVSFLSIALYVFYINQKTGGKWFFSLALPVIAYVAAALTLAVAFLRIFRQKRLFIIGISSLVLGVLMPVTEYLIKITFSLSRFIGWSFYPLIVFFLLGVLLIVLALYAPAREYMSRKFFI